MSDTATLRPWLQRGQALFPGGAVNVLRVPSDHQFVVARAEGSHVWDEVGRAYIDVVLGSGPLILGHAHEAVKAAVSRQLQMGTTYYNMSSPAIELGEAILEAFPMYEQLRFTSGGSDATYMAIRLARAATGRNRVLKFEGAFHGFHDTSMMSLSPQQPPAFPRGTPSSDGVSKGTDHDVLVAPFNDLKRTAAIVRQHRSELAAIIVEPVQRDIVPESGFLTGLRQLADEAGALLIFDEVVTGFRFRYGGIHALYGVNADLTCLGKIIGGGLPLAAVAGPENIMNLVVSKGARQPVYFSGTLSGNPLSAAAGLATLVQLRNDGVYEYLDEIGSRVRLGLEQAASAAGIEAQVTGFGSMFHLHLTQGAISNYRDTLAGARSSLYKLHLGVLRRGVFINPGAKSYLSLAHDESDVEQIVNVFAESMAELNQ